MCFFSGSNITISLFIGLIVMQIKRGIKMAEVYMQYICKNCDCIFLDKDVKGRMTPIKGCYCPECVEKYGFKNPETPPKKKLSNRQKNVLTKNKFVKRKNQSKNEVMNVKSKGARKNEY